MVTTGASGGGANEAVGAATSEPVESRPTSRALVATPLRLAQSARVAMPTNCPSTKQRNSRVGSRVGASATSMVRPPFDAGGASVGLSRPPLNTRAAATARAISVCGSRER